MKKTFLSVVSVIAMALTAIPAWAVQTTHQTINMATDFAVSIGQVAHDVLFTSMVNMGFVLFDSDSDPQPLQEITNLLKKQGDALEEFKTAQEKRLKEIEEKGKVSAETVAEFKKVSDQLESVTKELKAAHDRMDEMEKKANRPGAGALDADPEKAEHKQKFMAFMRKGIDDGLAALEKKVMQTGSDVDGGYLVPVELDAEIDRVASTVSAIGGLADVKTIGSSSIKMRVKTSGTAGRWVGDGEAGGETANPKFATVEIVAEELEIEPWVYNSMLDDADFDVEMDVTDEAGIGFGEAEGVAFVSGNGVKKPRGILAYDTIANANYAWGKVGYIASGKADGLADSNPADPIISLLHSLKSVYRTGAVLLMNDTTLGVLRKIKDGSGNFYLFNPDATGKFGGFILGAPVVIDDNMPDIAANAFPIAYVNLKRAYRVVNRKGTTLIRDNITDKGTTKFNFRKRIGGGIRQFEAIKLFKIATS